MNSKISCIFIFILTASFSLAYTPEYDDYVLTAEDKAAIKEAIPGEPIVEPDESKKLLVFSATAGFRHKSIPWGRYALKAMGDATGAYEAVVSDSYENFEWDKLRTFDAVCLLNTTGNLFMPPDNRKETFTEEEWAKHEARAERLRGNLFRFLEENSKGFVGIHGASDACYDIEEYGEMVGGYFWGHPWQWNQEIVIQVEEPDHALNQPVFEKTEYRFPEEIYQFQDPYSRGKVRVLVSLNESKSAEPRGEVRREDDDFPISWIHEFGMSKIFYTSLGHREDIYTNPVILKHYLAGIQYALRDLKASDEPSSTVGRGYHSLHDPEKILENAFRELLEETFEYGDDKIATDTLEWAKSQGVANENIGKVLRNGLHEFLLPERSAALQNLASHHLIAVGNEETIERARPLLQRESTRANAANLLRALDPSFKQDNRERIWLETASDDRLFKIFHDSGQPDHVRYAALAHLLDSERIPEKRLGEILISASESGFETFASTVAMNGYRNAIPVFINLLSEISMERQDVLFYVLTDLKAEGAFATMTQLSGDDPELLPAYVHASSRMGTVDAIPVFLDYLEKDRRLAIEGLSGLPGDQPTQAILNLVEENPGKQQASLIAVLGNRGDPEILKSLMNQLDSEEMDVLRATVQALHSLWRDSLVPELLEKLQTTDSEKAHSGIVRLLQRNLTASSAQAHRNVLEKTLKALPQGPVREDLEALLNSFG